MPGINYEALHNLVLRGDPRGAAAAQKLTPQEQQEYFDFQQKFNAANGMSEMKRPDNTLFGLPPEAAAVTGLGVGKLLSGGLKSLMPDSLTGAAKGALKIGGTVATYTAAEKAMAAMGIPFEARQAILLSIGLKGAMGAPAADARAAGAAARAESAAAAEKAAISESADLSKMGNFTNEEVLASLKKKGASLRQPSAAPSGPTTPYTPSSERSIPTPSNLSQKTSTQAVMAGEGPSGGARGLNLKDPNAFEVAGQPNVTRLRSLADTEGSQAAHEAAGSMRKGIQVEGDNVLDAYKDAKVLKKVKQRKLKDKD